MFNTAFKNDNNEFETSSLIESQTQRSDIENNQSINNQHKFKTVNPDENENASRNLEPIGEEESMMHNYTQ